MKHETISDGKTVWVNDSSGCCIGRFSKHGIDVHHSGKVQIDTGKACKMCKEGPATLDDWKTFKEGMKVYHGAIVSDSNMPKFLLSTL